MLKYSVACTGNVEYKGLFDRALAPLKMAPALAPLKEQLLWRSSSSGGAEAVLENVWQNGSFALDDVNPQQGAARSSFFRLLLRRQKNGSGS